MDTARQKNLDRLTDKLIGLTPRQQRILRMHYGLLSEGLPMTLTEIADSFEVTVARVRGIETKALARLTPDARNVMLACLQLYAPQRVPQFIRRMARYPR
jgi:DNA-directed RNA polymerase sigma subunit (sigma70/sigma32)